MLADLFKAVVELATKASSIKEASQLIELPDGRSMLAVKDKEPQYLIRPQRFATALHTVEALFSWLEDRCDDMPIFLDDKRVFVRDTLNRPGDDTSQRPQEVEFAAELVWLPHADWATVTGLIGRAFRPKELVTLGRTSLVDVFVDAAQKKAWRDTFQTIIATTGKEQRSDTRIASSNYGLDVKSSITSSSGSIETWDEFDLSVRRYQQLPDFRTRIRMALIADGESGTFQFGFVGNTLDDAREAVLDWTQAKLSEGSTRRVIRATPPDSLLPVIRC